MGAVMDDGRWAMGEGGVCGWGGGLCNPRTSMGMLNRFDFVMKVSIAKSFREPVTTNEPSTRSACIVSSTATADSRSMSKQYLKEEGAGGRERDRKRERERERERARERESERAREREKGSGSEKKKEKK